MKLPAYSAYKDSGIDWLGKVPEGWEILPLRRSMQTVKTGGTPSGAEDCHFEEDGFSWYTPSDFSDDVYLGKSNRTLSELGKRDVRLFPPMTVMMVGIGATIGKVGLSTEECSCNQQINGMVCEKKLNPVFATYSLKTMRDFIVKCGKFTTMPIINQDETKNLIITIPTIHEQQAIANFLDVQSAKIDALLVKRQDLINKMKEKRTALISRTVTQGLPPDAAQAVGLNPHPILRQSGVGWLGDVPEHWGALPLKYLAAITTGYAFSSDDFVDDGVPVLRIGDIARDGNVDLVNAKHLPEEYTRTYRSVLVQEGDIVMAMTGATIGKAGRYHSDKPALLNQRVCIFRPDGDNDSGYLWHLLNSGFYTEHITLTAFGGAQPNISDRQLLECSVPAPPTTEQHVIADYLDRETARIDAMTAKVEAAIDRLQEYRTALVSAAVTGKIDVRGWVA